MANPNNQANNSFTDWAENALMDHLFRAVQYPWPGGGYYDQYTGDYYTNGLYLTLSRRTPGEDGSGLDEPGSYYIQPDGNVIPGANGYAPVRLYYNHWGDPAERVIANAERIEFPQAISDWGTITNFALILRYYYNPYQYDYSYYQMAQQMVLYGQALNRTIPAGARFAINPGQLKIRFSPGGFSDYLAHKVLKMVTGREYMNVSGGMYAGLLSALPTDPGAAEPTGQPGYARAYLASNATYWPFAQNGLIKNAGLINYNGGQPATWGDINAIGVYDQPTGGNLMMSCALPLTLLDGSVYQIAPNSVTISLD